MISVFELFVMRSEQEQYSMRQLISPIVQSHMKDSRGTGMRISPSYLALILGASIAVTGWAQEAEENPDAETQAETSSTDESSTEGLSGEELSAEEIEIDDGSYLDAEEEDFRPSEEVPADQSIAFPTDI